MPTTPRRTRPIRNATLTATILLAGFAQASVIRVGPASSPGRCDAQTIQQAFDLAAGAVEPVHIRVTRAESPGGWPLQQVHVVDFDGSLVGGYASCEDDVPDGMTLLTGNSDAPLLSVRGHANLLVGNIEFRGGGGDGLGASIDYQANGSLALARVAATGARSALGAVGFRGINDASLWLGDDVRIVENDTSGLYVTGHSRLQATGHRTSISGNRLNGIHMVNIDDADLALGASEISDNDGYGIAWVNPSTPVAGAAIARFQSLGPDSRLRLSGNALGAVILLASGEPRTLCMRNVRIEDHVAEGAGIDYRGSVVRVDGPGARFTDVNAYCSLRPDSDFACPAGVCGAIHGNRSSGPLVSVTNGARLALRHGVVTGNQAPVLIAANAGTAFAETGIQLINALLAGNVAGDALFAIHDGGRMQITGATIAGNTGTFSRSFSATDSGSLYVFDSVVDQEQDLLHAEGSAAERGFHIVLARNATGSSPTDSLLIDVPRYRPSTYELAVDSPGVDAAVPLGGTDLNGHARDVDLPAVPNLHGARDLGAFETQEDRAGDAIFRDGFESRMPD